MFDFIFRRNSIVIEYTWDMTWYQRKLFVSIISKHTIDELTPEYLGRIRRLLLAKY